MKITAIETVVVNAEMRNWVFVKVETDEAGLHRGVSLANLSRGGRDTRILCCLQELCGSA